MAEDWSLTFVNRDFVISFSDVAPVGISHFSWAINYTSHDCYYHSFKMCSPALYLIECAFKVVHCTAASRAGYVLRSVETSSSRLHQFVNQIICIFAAVQTYLDAIFHISAAEHYFVKFLVKKSLSEIAGEIHKESFARRCVINGHSFLSFKRKRYHC